MEANELLIRVDEKLNLLLRRFEEETQKTDKRFEEMDRRLTELERKDQARSGFWDGARWMFGVVGAMVGSLPPSAIILLEKL